MKIHYGADGVKMKNAVLTVGTFDGVHSGHRKIISRLTEKAKSINGEAAVLTFNPHPRKVIFPEQNNLFLINTFEEKVDLFTQTGIDRLIVLEFSKEFSKLKSCEFISEILNKKLGVKHLIVGYDHRFGNDRQGNFDELAKCGRNNNIDVEKVEALLVNDVKISSTKIRKAISEGNISKANTFLSYDFFIKGVVVPGKQIGRKIGFPTANINPPKYKLLPKSGVYSSSVEFDGKKFFGMTNIGTKPTIDESETKLVVEVNIFNFSGELYGKEIKVSLTNFIRPEIKFDSLHKLQAQIKSDCEAIHNILKHA